MAMQTFSITLIDKVYRWQTVYEWMMSLRGLKYLQLTYELHLSNAIPYQSNELLLLSMLAELSTSLPHYSELCHHIFIQDQPSHYPIQCNPFRYYLMWSQITPNYCCHYLARFNTGIALHYMRNVLLSRRQPGLDTILQCLNPHYSSVIYSIHTSVTTFYSILFDLVGYDYIYHAATFCSEPQRLVHILLSKIIANNWVIELIL